MNRRAYQRALASFPWFIQDLPNPHLGSIKSVNFRWPWLPSPCCSPRLKPFLQLAASLVRHNCHITLITPHPTSYWQSLNIYLTSYLLFPRSGKSSFISSLLIHLQQTLLTLFFPAVGIHSPLCSPSLSILSSVSPPLNAVITDVTLISSVLPVTINLHLPNYIFFIHMQEWVTCWVFPFYCCIQNQLWFHSIWRWPWNSRLSFNAHTIITSSTSGFK